MRSLFVTAAVIAAVFACASAAPAAVLLDFNNLSHGRIVRNQYNSFSVGITITAGNYAKPHNLAVAYDTAYIGGIDSDLIGPPWAVGNLAPNEQFGRVLIIASDATDANNDGKVDFPDDEGSRPAGFIQLKFHSSIDSLGWDLLDIEPGEYTPISGYIAFFQGSIQVGRVGWGDFINPLSPWYDRTIEYGDMSANRFQPITAQQLGGERFNSVVFYMGGSGAIDNLRFTPYVAPPIPEPTVAGLVLMGTLALLPRRQR